MVKRIAGCLVFLAFLVVVSPHVYAQLSYEGSSSIGDTILPELAKAFEAKTGISFTKITSNDSSEGYKALMAGRVSLGGLSRLLTADEMKTEPGNRVIGYDAVVICVNKENQIANLTAEQLNSIFTGQMKNWKEVGGADMPIVTVLKEHASEGGTARQFCELILGGELPATPTISFPTTKECVAYVASNPAAITFASLAFQDDTVKYVAVDGIVPSKDAISKGEYPLARPYVLIYNNKPEDDKVTKFLEFVLSKEGQQIISKYLVPVTAFE